MLVGLTPHTACGEGAIYCLRGWRYVLPVGLALSTARGAGSMYTARCVCFMYCSWGWLYVLLVGLALCSARGVGSMYFSWGFLLGLVLMTIIRLILLLFRKVGSARLRESDTHPQSEDPSLTIPTYKQKKRKGKRVEDYSRDRAARQIKKHWLCS